VQKRRRGLLGLVEPERVAQRGDRGHVGVRAPRSGVAVDDDQPVGAELAHAPDRVPAGPPPPAAGHGTPAGRGGAPPGRRSCAAPPAAPPPAPLALGPRSPGSVPSPDPRTTSCRSPACRAARIRSRPSGAARTLERTRCGPELGRAAVTGGTPPPSAR